MTLQCAESRYVYMPPKHTANQQKGKQEPKSLLNRIFSSQISVAVVSTLISTLLLYVITEFVLLPHRTAALESKVDEFINTTEQIELLLQDEVTNRGNADNNLTGRIDDLSKRIDALYTAIIQSSNLRATPEFQRDITIEYNGIDRPSGKVTSLTATSVVAYDIDTNAQYTVGQLAEQKLLLPYTSNGQEVFFYGQLNAEGQWDGNCILNVYENDELVLITDAIYDDGKLYQYKQVFSYTVTAGQRVWAVSNRVHQEASNTGETRLYIWTRPYIKQFTIDSVAARDIVSADAFRDMLGDKLYGYYCGDTSDGLFNDLSGNAYMVYFFENGTVRLLYSGRFENGTFNDDTGRAWYIVNAEASDYMYHQGNLKNDEEGHSVITELGHPPLTLEEIQEYIGDRHYNVDLRWEGFDTSPAVQA